MHLPRILLASLALLLIASAPSASACHAVAGVPLPSGCLASAEVDVPGVIQASACVNDPAVGPCGPPVQFVNDVLFGCPHATPLDCL